MVSELIDKAFGGAARELVLQALSSRKMSSSDINEIHKFLDGMKGER